MADFRSIRPSWNRVNVVEPAPSAASDEPSVPGQDQESGPPGTFIGSGAVFEGTLTLTGDFQIDTEFHGELETDGAITVGAQGSVEGSIRAREVVIRGAVVGNVYAPRQLIVESTGKLHGDIETACLEIQKHAFFRGNTSMTQPQAINRMEQAKTTEFSSTAPPL